MLKFFTSCQNDSANIGVRPFHAAWTLAKTPGAHCINEGTVMLAGGIVNVVADALVTVIPIPLILRLKMPKHDQIGVLVLLSLGFFVTIAGIVRTYYIWLALVHTKDSSWYSHPLFIAAAVEVDVGIVSQATLFPSSILTQASSALAYQHYALSSHPTSNSSAIPSPPQ